MSELESVASVDEGLAQPAPAEPPVSPVPTDVPSQAEAAEASEAPAANGPALAEVLDAAARISGQLTQLSELFQARILHTEREDKIIDQMHQELQRYKEDLYAQLVRPILLDVVEVRDSIMRVGAAYRAKQPGEQDIPNKTFSDYAYDLQDILEKNGVEIYSGQPGEPFVPVRQRAVKKVATPDQALHGMVAESLSCGYGYGGRILSAEKVSVYTYEAPAVQAENGEDNITEVIEDG